MTHNYFMFDLKKLAPSTELCSKMIPDCTPKNFIQKSFYAAHVDKFYSFYR